MFRPSSASPEPSTPQQAGNVSKRRFGKKLYIIAAAVLIIVIIPTFLFSNNSTATVPLSLNYKVGERMVYATSGSTTIQTYNQTNNIPSTRTTSSNSTMTITVLSFDGKTYTLNNTYNLYFFGRQSTLNLTQQLSTADYVNNFLIGDASRLLYNMTGDKYDYYKLNLLQAKIGDTIQIPVNTGNESIGTTGTLNVKFASIEDLKVPAGTFKVFRLDYTADFTVHANLHGIINLQLAEPVPGQITGQTYLEYGTCRLIQSHVQETDQYMEKPSYNYTLTSDRTLTQLTKP